MFADRIALVTGGATGIGAATARMLAAQGSAVIVAGPPPVESLDKVCEEIIAAGGRARGYVCDVRDAGAIDGMFESVLAEYGRVDMVVHSAGIFHQTPAFDADRAKVAALVSVNFAGAVSVILSALHAMRGSGGTIVAVSSTQASAIEPSCAVYAATKAGLEHFVSGLAGDLRNSRIRVNCVAPGAVRTPMTAQIHDDATPEMLEIMKRQDTENGGPYSDFLMSPDAIAKVILFMLSDDSRPIHGTTILADQGYAVSALKGLR